jgi:hypothetical protein
VTAGFILQTRPIDQHLRLVIISQAGHNPGTAFSGEDEKNQPDVARDL